MAAKKITLETQNELNLLEKQRQALTDQRDLTVDESDYDILTADIAEFDKKITLLQNSIRLQALKDAEAARAKAIEKHQKDLARIGELKSKIAESDKVLFEALRAFFTGVQAHYELAVEAYELSTTAAKTARAFELDPVQPTGLKFLGAIWQGRVEEICEKLISAYALQFWLSYDARKRGTPVPDTVPSLETISMYGYLTFNPDGTVYDPHKKAVVTPVEVKPTPEAEPKEE